VSVEKLTVMAWRIHFTADDLARTTVAGTLGPFAETVLGLSMLHRPCPRPALYDSWRERMRSSLNPQMKPLTALMPIGAVGLDLLTLVGEAPTMGQGVDALLAMRREDVLTELEYGARRGRLPASAWTLATRDGAGRRRLADAALAAYEVIVAPHWARMQSHLRAERANRGRILLDGGVERLLATLHPERIRWRPPVLEIEVCPELDLHLGGRGLTLVPSVFVGRIPVLLWDLNDRSAPPRLVFSAARDPLTRGRLLAPSGNGTHPLAALVGRTRAAALRQIGDGCTTSELARHLGVSPAAASQHATVLRDAGLITTLRQGNRVWHSLTPLGFALLGD
jgi:DNA-binding transcriptional ArsR family regulator